MRTYSQESNWINTILAINSNVELHKQSPRMWKVTVARRAKLGQIQGGLQRDSQDSTRGGCNNVLLCSR